MLEMFREPINTFIFLEHQRLTTLDIEEPARNRTIHNALLTARVKRIFVLDIFNLPDDALLFKTLCDELVRCPDL